MALVESPLTGQKVLVITYKPGGESSFAKLVPLRTDPAPNNQLEVWWTNRTNHRFFSEVGGAYNQASVLAEFAGTNLTSTPPFAMHPNYSALMPLWNAGDLAIVPNCGILIEPIPDGVSPNNPAYRFPTGIAAHDNFQIHNQYMSGDMATRSRGWIGHLADILYSSPDIATTGLGTAIFNTGIPSAVMGTGNDVKPFAMPRMAGVVVTFTTQVAAVNALVRQKLEESVAAARTGGSIRIQKYQQSFQACIDGMDFANPTQTVAHNAAGPVYDVDASFPVFTGARNGFWRSMFWRAARLIEDAKAAAGATPMRMCILIQVGDWDTHANEKNRFTGVNPFADRPLATEYGEGLAQFAAAMDVIGMWDNVVVADPTDFGRTLWTNGGDGTDHAWGFPMFLSGGLIRGKGKDGSTGILGPWPDVISVNGTGTREWRVGGHQIPSISYEQIFDPILGWMGLTVEGRQAVMTNRGNFSTFIDALDI